MITTKVSPAKKGTESLRTTVPEAVREILHLKPGNEVEWVVGADGKVEFRKKEGAS